MPALATRLRLFFSVRHRTIGAVILRVCLGFNTLVMYALHFPQRAFIWGDQGVIPLAVNSTFLQMRHSASLYDISGSDQVHAVIFLAGIFVTGLFTVGFQTRVTSVLFFIFTFSLYARNEIVLDGGDNLLILVAFFLMFVDVSGKYIPGRADEAPPQNPYISVVHNLGIGAIILQICILYFTSAWAKMMGHMWQDGTAIYYILRSSEFNLSPLTDALVRNDVLETLLTYGTILLQIGFPFVIWHRTLKYPWILGAFSFHVGIAYFMGLVWFSLTMLSCEFILIGDQAYVKAGRYLRPRIDRALLAARQRISAKPRAVPAD
jgi:hypothetical protein